MIKDGRKQNQILSLLPWEFHKDIQSIKKENTKNKRRKTIKNRRWMSNLFTSGFFWNVKKCRYSKKGGKHHFITTCKKFVYITTPQSLLHSPYKKHSFDVKSTDVLRNDAAPLLFQFSVQSLHSRSDKLLVRILRSRKVVELLQL